MSGFRSSAAKLGVVAAVVGLGLTCGSASAANAATIAATRPAAATAAATPAVPPFYTLWDSKIPTIQACVEEGENLKAQGIISAFACVAGSGGFNLWVQLIGACSGSVSSSEARITSVAVRPTAC
jgi:hypothetical protein